MKIMQRLLLTSDNSTFVLSIYRKRYNFIQRMILRLCGIRVDVIEDSDFDVRYTSNDSIESDEEYLQGALQKVRKYY